MWVQISIGNVTHVPVLEDLKFFSVAADNEHLPLVDESGVHVPMGNGQT